MADGTLTGYNANFNVMLCVCNDNNPCTTDTCDATGQCIHTPIPNCSSTTGNNFTWNTSLGGIWGGTNDVVFTWDGSAHATVTGVSNASLTSNEPISDFLWYAKDVEVVGPGTHTVDLYAIRDVWGSPGNTFYEVTVPAGKLGVHLLFDWGGANQGSTPCCKELCNVDVWNVWDLNKTFYPTQARDCFFAGSCKGFWAAEDNGTNYTDQSGVGDAPTPCHDPVPLSVLDGSPNHFNKVWSLVSIDAAGRKKNAAGTTLVNYPLDNVPGLPMADGALAGFNANFNVKTVQ